MPRQLRLVVLFSLVGLLASAAFVGPGAQALPPLTPTAIADVIAVDPAGRYVVAETFESSPSGGGRTSVLIDRLTGRERRSNPVKVVSGNLVYAATVEDASGGLAWTNLRTGTSSPLPGPALAPGKVTAVQFSDDGELLLVDYNPDAGTGAVAVVLTRSGGAEVSPVAGASPVDMSANGRWVLLVAPRTVSLPPTFYRWDRQTGGVTIHVTSPGYIRNAKRIGDEGQVFEQEFVSGGPFSGGTPRYVSRSLTGAIVQLAPTGSAPAFELSADGSLFAPIDAGTGIVTVVDTATGRSDVLSTPLRAGYAVSSSGNLAMGVRLGGSTSADLVVLPVPGRAVQPKVAAGEVVVVPVAGVRGVPADASAVVLNLTVTNPAGPGFVTVWPCDEARPNASNLNFTGAGTTVANAVLSKVAVAGPSIGAVCVYTLTATELLVDVQGYFTGTTYSGLVPDRFLDTRNGETDSTGNMGGGTFVAVPIAGLRGVPADASAVVLNVTATNPAGAGFVTVWPCDESRPDASNVNLTRPAVTVANAVIAKVAGTGPAAGSVCLYTSTGADVIVDVQGFFTGGAYSGIAPDRFVDTRNGESDSVGNVGAGGVVTVPVAGVRGVPQAASAAVLNVTVTNPAGPGFVTVWPCDQPRPDASNVNFTGAGVTVANAVVSKLAAAGSVCLYTSTGADVIVDVQGSFTGAAYTGLTPDRFVETRG